MESENGLVYVNLKKGDYVKQIKAIIKKYFTGCKIYNGKYENENFDNRFLFFRGQSKYRWRLKPTINRVKCDEKQILETSVEEFKLVKKEDQEEKLIAYAQHHGKNTRAIDFTSDFKVALYFACNANELDDGAIYITAYVPHKIDWISSLTINLISRMEDKIVKDIDLAKMLINYVNKDGDYEYKEKYLKRNQEISIPFICAEYSSYLQSGFMTVYDYVNEDTNKRIKLQKGSLFYCGCKYFIGNKHCIEIGHSTVDFPQYNIHLHEIENPKWLNQISVKVRIPKKLKQDILKTINLNDKDLGLE